MADYTPLNRREEEAAAEEEEREKKKTSAPRLASLDVFRGLSIFLMIFVDYAGSVLPVVAHSPWNGVHLADFVMPFFLFIAGVSIALVYKNISNKFAATSKAIQRAINLFLLGIILQGGYFHGVNSLTFGVNIERIRWFGILQMGDLSKILQDWKMNFPGSFFCFFFFYFFFSMLSYSYFN